MGLLKVTSILQEPAHFGAVMAPAMFVALLNIIKNKKYFISKIMSLAIIFSTLLSFSAVSYIGIIIAVVLIMLNYRTVKFIAAGILILFALTIFSYRNFSTLKLRADDTFLVMTNRIPLEFANLSTFAFVSNFLVTKKNFTDSPLFGSGLGSYPISYEKYIKQVINIDKRTIFLNNTDADSLLLRLISETGLLGVVLFFYFIIRFYVSKRKDDYYWMISNSILCLFIINLLRMGNYFYNGFIIFIWMYYFTGKNISNHGEVGSLSEFTISNLFKK
jgi:O-antigen ligase